MRSWPTRGSCAIGGKNYPLKIIQINGSFNTSDAIKLNFRFEVNNVNVLRHCQSVEFKKIETKTPPLKIILELPSNSIEMKSILNVFSRLLFGVINTATLT
jgi:hypothetical protein